MVPVVQTYKCENATQWLRPPGRRTQAGAAKLGPAAQDQAGTIYSYLIVHRQSGANCVGGSRKIAAENPG